MTPTEKAARAARHARQSRAKALLLNPVVIAACDRANEALEITAHAIAKARVSSQIELLLKDDDELYD